MRTGRAKIPPALFLSTVLLAVNFLVSVYCVLHLRWYQEVTADAVRTLAGAILAEIGVAQEEAFRDTRVKDVVAFFSVFALTVIAAMIARHGKGRAPTHALVLFLSLLALYEGPVLPLLARSAPAHWVVGAVMAIAVLTTAAFLRFCALFPRPLPTAALASSASGAAPPGAPAGGSRSGLRRHLARLWAWDEVGDAPVPPLERRLIVLLLVTYGVQLLVYAAGWVILLSQGARDFLGREILVAAVIVTYLRKLVATGVGALLWIDLLGTAIRRALAGRGWKDRLPTAAPPLLLSVAAAALAIRAAPPPPAVDAAPLVGWILMLGGIVNTVRRAAFTGAAALLVLELMAARSTATRVRWRYRLVVLLLAGALSLNRMDDLATLLFLNVYAVLLPALVLIAFRPYVGLALGRKVASPGAPPGVSRLRVRLLDPGVVWTCAAALVLLALSPTVAARPLLYLAILFLPLCAVLLAAVSCGVSYLRASYLRVEPAEQRQIVWVVNGFVAALWLLFLGQVDVVLPGAWAERVAVLAGTLVLPAVAVSLAMATFARGAFDPALLLRRTSVYGLAGVVGVILFAGIENLLQDGLADWFDVPPRAVPWLAGGAVALLFGPVRNRIESRVVALLGHAFPVGRILEQPPDEAAVVVADLVGAKRLAAADERGAAALAALLRSVAQRSAAAHGGRVVECARDLVLLEFPDGSRAFSGSRQLLSAFSEERRRLGLPASQLRVGIDHGPVLRGQDGALFGRTVDNADRLRLMAEPGTLVASGAVVRQVRAGGTIEVRLEPVEDPSGLAAYRHLAPG